MVANRHVTAALLVMPLLALLGWWAVGNLLGEQPQAARKGMVYPLVAQSGCRYAGGTCTLENVDVRLTLKFTRAGPEHYLDVRASLALDDLVAAVGSADDKVPPRPMTPRDGRGNRWRLALRERPEVGHRIRLVARARGSSWFGEAGTVFLQPADG